MQVDRKYAALADVLLAALAQKECPQQWVASKLFVSQVAVSRWINGRRRPAPDRLGHLAALFRLNPIELAVLAHYDDDLNAHDKMLDAYKSWSSVT